ncbi:MAG TPA: glutamate--tRNA ligase family protein [Vicinamibacterales bacterium]|nr:glutamate--tRNA ligase family protein [Vicinamibacterales bacterium]
MPTPGVVFHVIVEHDARRRSCTRFAPAPTGYLHLGHVLNARYVWGLARQSSAEVLLRIEDHDRERCRPEYERGILDDLDWLGFAPDIYPTTAFRAGACESRQSERGAVYEAAARELQARGLLYGCTCTRRDLIPSGPDIELRYPETCRDRGIGIEPGVVWRLRLEPGSETFEDLICGPQRQDPSRQCGDLAIRDRLGNWTYQFVASVDDFRQDIDLIIRGRDLLESTGRQIRIARLLGRPRPARFAHHELVMKSSTQKLSKSDGDTAIRDLRARGLTREQVLARVRPFTGYEN